MLQCWRSGCELAGNPIAQHFEALVEKRTRSLAANLWSSAYEEARQEVTTRWLLKLLNNPSCDPERVAALRNVDAWSTRAIVHLYFTWYDKNIQGMPTLVGLLDSDQDDDSWAAGASPRALHELRDPGEIVPERLSNSVVSEAGESKVAAALRQIQELLQGTDDATFFAGWMRFAAHESDSGRRPSAAEYSRQVGVSKATGSRRINRTLTALRALVHEAADADGEERDFTLNLLNRLLALADPTREGLLGTAEEGLLT